MDSKRVFELIYKFALTVIVIVLIKVVFVYVREYVMSSVQQKIMMRFRIELFDRLVVLPIKYFDENKTGYIMSRITNDVNNIEQSITLIVEMAQNLVYTFVYAAALFYTNWQLALMTILILRCQVRFRANSVTKFVPIATQSPIHSQKFLHLFKNVSLQFAL